jgi:hypothetical protein
VTDVIIDCDTCEVRGLACDDCVVTVLLGPTRLEVDDGTQAALDALAGSGLVPPLRLVTPVEAEPSQSPPRWISDVG